MEGQNRTKGLYKWHDGSFYCGDFKDS